MEKVTKKLEKGDKVKLNVLLKSVYQLGNKMVCQYRSGKNLIEMSLYSDDLTQSYSTEKDDMILTKELIVEDMLENFAICRIDGSHQMLTLPKQDLAIITEQENLVSS